MGKSFEALKTDGSGLAYLDHLDNAFLNFLLYGMAPKLSRLIASLPIPCVREFMSASDQYYKVSCFH